MGIFWGHHVTQLDLFIIVPQIASVAAGVFAPGEGAIMSFDNREDFEKNLNGSLTVVTWNPFHIGNNNAR